MLWSDSAVVCLQRRILAKDPESGAPIESPEDMLQRVAWNVSQAELKYPAPNAKIVQERVAEDFYQLMHDLVFLPNSPCLVNAGRPLQQLAACFVLPVGDSINAIFDAVKAAAVIHQSGGGTGFSFGRLRPKGSRVKSTGNVASGPVSFMKVFDAATAAIKQGGVRRGANMGVLPINHPDVREFIHLKNDENALTNFNISLAVSDHFVSCLRSGEPFPLEWGGHVFEYVDAAELWQEIADSAWTSGDPGVLFMDRINEFSTIPNMGAMEATNPCGEVPLLPYHTCNLGSIDVSKFWLPTPGTLDWPRLEKTVETAVRFLDNVIDMNKYPHELIDYNTKLARKIGLGIMGWADLLIKARLIYGSPQALSLARLLMQFIQEIADETSIKLGRERGRFPAWQGSVYDENGENLPHRNATRTVIAPTGTLSILANCSSGIEPLFGLTYLKNVMDTQIGHVSEAAKELMLEHNIWTGQNEAWLQTGNTVASIVGADHPVAMVLRTAHEISVEEHLLTQAAFQENTDDSISKTINFNHSATPADILDTYLRAYELGCKGVTVYRDGCRTAGQVLQFHNTPVPLSVQGLGSKCPECSGALVHAEGCEECVQCGASMCSA